MVRNNSSAFRAQNSLKATIYGDLGKALLLDVSHGLFVTLTLRVAINGVLRSKSLCFTAFAMTGGVVRHREPYRAWRSMALGKAL